MSNLLLGLDYIWFSLMGFRFLGQCVSHDIDFDWVLRVQKVYCFVTFGLRSWNQSFDLCCIH